MGCGGPGGNHHPGGGSTYSNNTYNADGQLVEAAYPGFNAKVEGIFDPAGGELGYYDGVNNAWFDQDIWAAGRMVAQLTPTDTYFLHSNHLHSNVQVTDHSGAVKLDLLYYPWGQIWQKSGSLVDAHFAGFQRGGGNVNVTPTRRYSNVEGRWLSPDPVIITPDRLSNPEQLNLYSYVANNPLRYIDPTGEILTASGNLQADYQDLCAIVGDACAKRLQIDQKMGNVTFNTGAIGDNPALDLSKNEGAALVNDLASSQNTYEFGEGPTVMTSNGPMKIDYIIANLPTFGDQPQSGHPKAGVADVVGLNFDNKNITRISNTKLGVAQSFTTAFHELAEAYEKIDGGKGGSYAAGHNAALQREMTLRNQRPYLKGYNTGAGGPANSPNPEGGIIIKK